MVEAHFSFAGRWVRDVRRCVHTVDLHCGAFMMSVLRGFLSAGLK